jgi:hypothetical protein
MGSGTTLVQGNELNLHTIGIDISEFNCLIAKVKTDKYDLNKLKEEIVSAERRLEKFSKRLISHDEYQMSLFPEEKLEKLKKSLMNEVTGDYLIQWFAERTLYEMMYYRRLIEEFEYKDLLRVLLSRATRSSRLVPHYDLATPKNPIPPGKEYWCRKHNRYCKPIEELLKKIHQYSMDTFKRIKIFDELRSDKYLKIIQGDSRTLNISKALHSTPLENELIDGIFTSPPYVGQIDYHEQHRYAYELFGFKRMDTFEIGPKKTGKSKNAQGKYVEEISSVFRNVNKYVKKEAKIFIVANDKFDLYPEIARKSGMVIKDTFHRAVTKRTEQGDNPYQETIFYMMKDEDS